MFYGGVQMAVETYSFQKNTEGETDIIDITGEIEKIIAKSSLHGGVATVFVSGSTAGITTVEYEPGLVKDLKQAYERIAPRNGDYSHNLRWGDGNGYAHVRASMTGQDMNIPFSHGKLMLGTWQQIILVDFDNRKRTREINIQLIGE
jgi:secondary thiamine-phosphate synthase enzyme